MSSGTRDEGWGKGGVLLLCLVPLASSLVPLSGCRTVVDTLAGVIGPDGGEVIDAHVVYRLRPDCPTLLARTVDNGYTVLTPTEVLAASGDAAPEPPEAGAFEATGLFEGPVRAGTVVFRYIPPEQSETWTAGSLDVVATVEAVRLDLPAAHDRMIEVCGPVVEGEPADLVPRLPGQR